MKVSTRGDYAARALLSLALHGSDRPTSVKEIAERTGLPQPYLEQILLAVKGAGAALLSPLLFQELIAQGALVAPFSQCTEGVGGYWLLWGKEAADAHFVRWMRDEFKV